MGPWGKNTSQREIKRWRKERRGKGDFCLKNWKLLEVRMIKGETFTIATFYYYYYYYYFSTFLFPFTNCSPCFPRGGQARLRCATCFHHFGSQPEETGKYNCICSLRQKQKKQPIWSTWKGRKSFPSPPELPVVTGTRCQSGSTNGFWKDSLVYLQRYLEAALLAHIYCVLEV